MLERIQMIDNVGNYYQVNAGSITFSPVNIIYGENRNGKSTLCDIFYSLSLNNPQLVIDRKSIIPTKEPSQVKQTVTIKFSGQSNAVKFSNNIWNSVPPQDSKLYIFDHGFIHRNVMTGTSYNRENSTNISGFILGDNVEKFKLLEIKNQKIRDDKKKLGLLKQQFESHSINNIDAFTLLPLPDQTLAQLESSIEKSKDLQQEIYTQISNITQVSLRENLEKIARPTCIKGDVQAINNCLALNMNNVHQLSKDIVLKHKEKVKNETSFDGWAALGVTHLKDDCPFCGQDLQQEAESLINSYKTAFDKTFQDFVSQTKAKVTQLQKTTLINSDIQSIREKHERNIKLLATYVEDSVKIKLDESLSIQQLVDSFKNIEISFEQLSKVYNEKSQIIKDSLALKQEISYNPINLIDFTDLQDKFSNFDESIVQYNLIKDMINIILTNFKGSQDITSLEEKKHIEVENQKKLEKNKKRLLLNSESIQYCSLKIQIDSDSTSYEADKVILEKDQENFLDTYFNEINTLFRKIGSSDFTISRKINRGGARTVYDLEVSFKGRAIDKTKFHCLFSESDRRALALCIFLAKIQQLPNHEKLKAILVMDDPVTSFDNERISNILGILFNLKVSIKQMIITTHYKGMASAVMKKFNDAKAMKIVQSENGSKLVLSTKDEMTATAHEETYKEIMDFIEYKTQDNKLSKLRPFIEDEMRKRYKLPLTKLGFSEVNTFNDCIEILKKNNHISESIATALHDYRTTLNLPAHELSSWVLDDSRTYAKGMMDFIYSDL